MRKLFLILVAVQLCAAMPVAEQEDQQREQQDKQIAGNLFDNPIQNRGYRVKRDWPFRSSQQNAGTINDYYQTRPSDDWWVKYVQKPFARYVGRSFGDEFPAVRDSIISHQNRGQSFSQAHQFDTGYHPDNWRQYNWNNDYEELADPY